MATQLPPDGLALIMARTRGCLSIEEKACVTAWARPRTVRSPDLRCDPRWPRLGAAVAGLDVRAVVSAPLMSGGHPLGRARRVITERHGMEEEESMCLLLRRVCDEGAIL